MGHQEQKKFKKDKKSLLTLSIIGLGYLVVFGLGFIFGLNYCQTLYFAKQDVKNLQLDSRDDLDVNQSSFYYSLKEKKVDPIITSKDEESSNKTSIKTSSIKKDIEPIIPTTESDQSKKDLRYTIQIYSFRSEEISSKMVSELLKKGYPAYHSKIATEKDGVFYRVRVGNFKNRSDALGTLKKICEYENKDAFITLN
ncbi:SPOR domain-containing protein [bacterium]|nr:SPOR domain-containing protein [bacterium]